MAVQQITLQGEPGSVPRARRFVEQVLTAWELDELVWTGTLLVSELTTNACLHARTPLRVTLERTVAGGVRMGVDDGSPFAPRVRQYAEQATTGRGMRLVSELSARWGVEQLPDGKSVWVELLPERGGEGLDDDEADLDGVLARFHDGAVEPASGPVGGAAGGIRARARAA